MKFVVFISVIFLLSCSGKNSKQDVSIKEKQGVILKEDQKRLIPDSGIDSVVYYFTKQVDFVFKRDQCEIKYLKTQKDKYRVEGNRYVDSAHFYSQKLQRLAARK